MLVVSETPPAVRRTAALGLVPVLGVVVQAVIGGLSVIYDLNPAFVGSHLLISMALVAFSAWLVVRTREGDASGGAARRRDPAHPDPRAHGPAPPSS